MCEKIGQMYTVSKEIKKIKTKNESKMKYESSEIVN